jgi:hypothetical protein
MHPRSIAARNDAARQSIKTAAAALADALGLPPLADMTEPERRDRDVAQMRELECIAALLGSVVEALREEIPHGPEREEVRPRSRGRRVGG